jgi:hypothetical protein
MVLDLITTTATVVIAAGVPIAAIQIRNAARNERYSQYISRYEKIVTHLPFGIFDEGSERIEISEKHKTWLVAYIDLCTEELFDYLRGAIGGRIWEDWTESITKDFKRGKQLREIFDGLDQTEYKDLKSMIEKEKTPPRWSLWKRFRAT